ncbi:MAG: hypothetical protein C0409_00455 [Novosphingobium sp.]|nr:hypothetical protein [Novosphingobium sp.]
MASPPLPFTAVPWDAGLAGALADACAALARLDARVCASPLKAAWKMRASWAGYAQALQLQQSPLEEIDIIADSCGLRLPARPVPRTEDEPFAAFAPWQALLGEPAGRHWAEGLPFTFDAPPGWRDAPALVRALTLLDLTARADRSGAAWLALPVILRRVGLTQGPLPSIVVGEPSQRPSLRPVAETRAAALKRLLRHVTRRACDGLDRLDRLEAATRRSAAAIAAEHRPGKLLDLARISLAAPCLAARSAAPLLGITISGAGKLLERATGLGIMAEISGRGSWRTYVTPDLAVALGQRAPDRGRPPAVSTAPAVAAILSTFELEMADIDARLKRLGIAVAGDMAD